MRTLSNELMHQYDINVKKYQYARSNYYLETNKGKMLLRKMNITKEQIAFEYEVNHYLLEQQFNKIPKIYMTKKKLPYAIYQDKRYLLQECKEGAEIDFKVEEDLKETVALLASFHIYGRNFVSGVRNVETSSIKNIQGYCIKRYQESRKIKKVISEKTNKPLFERMFLKDYRYYEELEEIALQQIDGGTSQLLMQEARKNASLVHNEYNYHAINKTTEGSYYITNLDNCIYNIQVIDLANILSRIMQKNNWNIELLKGLIETYDQIRPLNQQEMKALKALLIFPEKYASICHNYTQTKRRGNYSVFEVKWTNMLEYLEPQQKATLKIIHTL